MPKDLVEIARFTSSMDAALAKNRLDSEGILSRLDGEAMASWFWHLGGATGGVKLLVKGQDAQRAAEVLAATPAGLALGNEEGAQEEPEEDAEDQTSEVSPELIYAYRAAILGLFFLPPLPSIYSMYLLFRHGLFRQPRNWRVGVALVANLMILFTVGMFFWIVLRDVVASSDYVPMDGIPLELRRTLRYPLPPQ